jgi:Tol biopolymer transport system component
MNANELRKKTRWFRAALVALILLEAAWALAQRPESPEALLQRAIQKQEVDGDPKAAIEIYTRITSDAAVGSPTKAQAWLNMGRSYEFLSVLEAKRAYERVLDFPDQREAVDKAQGRLKALASSNAPERNVYRQVWSGEEMVPVGRVSPDGRHMVYVVPNANKKFDLVVREIATRLSKTLLSVESITEVSFPVWSSDKRIAFVSNNKAGTGIRSVSLDDPTPRIILSEQRAFELTLLAWSPDGRILATAVEEVNITTFRVRLIWVDVATRKLTTLAEMRPVYPYFGAAISPDGRYIVFGGVDLLEIRIIDRDGHGESVLTAHPDDLMPVGWTEDGAHVLVVTRRNGNVELMALPVTNGKAAGSPKILATLCQACNNSDLASYGLTNAGAFYYSLQVFASNIYTATLDPKTGAPGLPTPIRVNEPADGSSIVWPQWSPDGKKLAFYGDARNTGQRTFSILTVDSGNVQRLQDLDFGAGGYCWLGNDALLVRRQSGSRITAMIRVEISTRKETVLFEDNSGNTACSGDGKVVSYRSGSGLKIRNLGTPGSFISPTFPGPLRSTIVPLSWDGTQLLFIAETKGSDALFISSLNGAIAKELTRVTPPEEFLTTIALAWSPNGRYVYFVKRATGNADYELFRVPTSGGGKEESLGLSGVDIRDLDISPDGSRIAFSTGKLNRPELRVVDTFLPGRK